MATTQRKKKKKDTQESVKQTTDSTLIEKYNDAIEVLRQIDRLPMESYHLEKFKRKWRGEV